MVNDMDVFLLLFISILPIFLIGKYVYTKDSVKEPTGLLVKLFFCGVGAFCSTIFLTIILGFFFPSILSSENNFDLVGLFFHVFFGIALIEEFCKWIFVYKIGFNNPEFDQIYDMVVYSTFVALGFACIENVFYVFENGFLTGVIRALFAVPGHACNGVFMGYYLSMAKFYGLNNTHRKRNLFLSLFVPILLHGFYDYCLFSGNILFILFFLVFIILLYIITVKKVKRVSDMSSMAFKDKFCPNCGHIVDSNICVGCGRNNE